MDHLFHILSSSARIDKSRQRQPSSRTKKRARHDDDDDDLASTTIVKDDHQNDDDAVDHVAVDHVAVPVMKSRDRTGKRDTSERKQRQVQYEQMIAFRRSMNIQVKWNHGSHNNNNNNHGGGGVNGNHDNTTTTTTTFQNVPDAISKFDELSLVLQKDSPSVQEDYQKILHTIETDRSSDWTEPTPIQMQAIPCLMARHDVMCSAPTGSGKSGAFIIPALLLSAMSDAVFYHNDNHNDNNHDDDDDNNNNNNNNHGEETTTTNHHDHHDNDDEAQGNKRKRNKKNKKKKRLNRQGEIRTLLLAPSRELAMQLHREVERLGRGGGGNHNRTMTSLLLTRSNASSLLSGSVGGQAGLDVLVTTPMRLVDVLQSSSSSESTTKHTTTTTSSASHHLLHHVRLVVLDEADRLLDATDLKTNHTTTTNKESSSGSNHTKTFISQLDIILSACPTTAIRALFSATITPSVQELSDSILRHPISITITNTIQRTNNNNNNNNNTTKTTTNAIGGANSDITQELLFCGREEGKLLAMRQLFHHNGMTTTNTHHKNHHSGTTTTTTTPSTSSSCVRAAIPALVFCESQERAQALFMELLYDGLHVDVLHAGRSSAARDAAIVKFRRGETWILICTDLVSRGVDLLNCKCVINYDIPMSGITYVHRIGRTGRAGRKGTAITFFTEDDFPQLRTIANIMRQSGCHVPEWMLRMKKQKLQSQQQQKQHDRHDDGHHHNHRRLAHPTPRRRSRIDTTPKYDTQKKYHKRQIVQQSKKKQARIQMKDEHEEEK